MSSSRFLRSGIHWARGNQHRGTARNLQWATDDVSRAFPNQEEERKKRKRTDSTFERSSIARVSVAANHPLVDTKLSDDVVSAADMSSSNTSSSFPSLLVTHPPSFLTVKSLSSELPEIGGAETLAPIDSLSGQSDFFGMDDPLGSLDDDGFLNEETEEIFNLFGDMSESNSTSTECLSPPLKVKKALTKVELPGEMIRKHLTNSRATVAKRGKKRGASSASTETKKLSANVSVKKSAGSAPSGDRRGRKNFRERQRRQTMKEKFDELTQLIVFDTTSSASEDGQKLKKMDVLSKAIETIKDLQLQVAELQSVKVRNDSSRRMIGDA